MKRGAFGRKVIRTLSRVAEAKYYLASSGGYVNCTDVGDLGIITSIPQSTLAGGRTGISIYVKSISYRATVYNPNNAMDAASVRVIIFQWHNDATLDPPQLGQILINNTGSDYFVHAPYNPNFRNKYTILFDRMICPMGTSVTKQVPINVVITRGFQRKLNYVGITDTGYNMIYVARMSDDTVSPRPQLANQVKVNYMDC